MEINYKMRLIDNTLVAKFEDNTFPAFIFERLSSIDNCARFTCNVELGELMCFSDIMLRMDVGGKLTHTEIELTLKHKLSERLRHIANELEKSEVKHVC